jgi:hypothetical protein
MQKYARLLHLNPSLASKVRTLTAVFHDEEEDRGFAKVWGLTRPPILPRCTELYVVSDMHNNPRAIPLEEVFTWVVNCPGLKHLGLCNSATAVTSYWGDDVNHQHHSTLSLDQVGIYLPKTLIKCTLNDYIGDMDYSLQFWQAFEWVEHLSLEFYASRRRDLELEGFDRLRESLRRLSIIGVSLDSGLVEQLVNPGLEFHRLERLDCLLLQHLPFILPFTGLRILNIKLPAYTLAASSQMGVTTEQATRAILGELCRGIRDGMFPALQQLKLKSPLDIAELAHAEGLDDRCVQASVALTTKVTLEGNNSTGWQWEKDEDYE